MERDWTQFENFSASEFVCQHTGKEGIELDFVEKVQKLRTAFGRPMAISSGYRSPEHPIEARKAKPGAHASGRAVDIAIAGADALHLLQLALDSGDFTGVGIAQKGDFGSRFIHLDDLNNERRPTIWSY
jgi:uncharacterized protein YcbK (DUF882 family)